MKILWPLFTAVLAQEGAFEGDEGVYVRPAFGPEIRGRMQAPRPTLRPVGGGKRPIKKVAPKKVAKKSPKKVIKKKPIKKVPKKKVPPRPKTTKKTTTTTTTTTTTSTTTTEETTTVPATTTVETTESVVEEQREVVELPEINEAKGWNTYNQYPNNYNNNQVQNVDQYITQTAQGYAAGDPHFMVETEGQPPICFDFNPPMDADLNLFSDPESGLMLTATLEENEKGDEFITQIHFRSPDGSFLKFGLNGVMEEGLDGERGIVSDPLTGDQIYGDLSFFSNWNENGLHEHTKVKVENGPTFIVRSNLIHRNLQVAVSDAAGVSSRTKGVIGLFTRPNAYFVTEKGPTEDEEQLASVTINGHDFNALLQRFHHTEACWVIAEMDALDMLAILA
ncbi:Oidioi.mRNA.OKI2018_I69.chr2.g4667.t1.cds [Oikopleura dioica]|uniref:Oidioi.mRNA.OKI2018_I69.chr2.g4667.t1.cds n=1 Tax=Oikopleura dioica TaxID=34765 RepID=A0ABN7SZM8_OIKDI|nr:Oidioi.mRNA.OKI2018_I69.chr2.g4667.t1.cds [Oikopleura dioica]